MSRLQAEAHAQRKAAGGRRESEEKRREVAYDGHERVQAAGGPGTSGETHALKWPRPIYLLISQPPRSSPSRARSVTSFPS